MTTSAARGLPAALSLLVRLQVGGAAWTGGLPAGAAGRAAVAASMAHYQRLLSQRAGEAPSGDAALPPALVIVGTKGKGSTAALAEAALRAHGLRTGLFTSPHLVCPGERLRLAGRPLPRARFLAAFWAAADALAPELRALEAEAAAAAAAAARGQVAARARPEGLPPGLPGFNLLALLALRLFAEERVDVMILEAGVGGRLDAVAAVPRPVACGVTTLDFDHMELLGDTLPAIAGEKAGIFRAGVPAVTVPQRADAMAALCAAAAAEGTPLWLADPAQLAHRARLGGSAGGSASDGFPALGLAAPYQRTNAALAVALSDIFLASHARGHAPAPPPPPDPAALTQPRVLEASSPLSAAMLTGLRTATWPGRAQTVDLDAAGAVLPPAAAAAHAVVTPAPPPPVAVRLLLDGAHTEASMAEAVRWLHLAIAGAACGATRPRLVLVFTCGHDKTAVALLLPLSTLTFDRVYMCGVPAGLAAKRPPPTAAEALAAYAARHGAAQAQVRAPDALPPGGWAHTLAALWQSVHVDPSLAAERERLAHDLRSPHAPPLLQPPAPTDAPVVCDSAADALHAALSLPPPPMLQQRPPGAPHTVVVVCGSLYLVGAALAHVHWRE